MVSATAAKIEPWRRRLYIPNYQVGEAARYAAISPQTVAAWHRIEGNKSLLSHKEQRAALSYLQMIEVAVVAAFRKAGVKLPEIRAARDYVQITLKKEYPFAQYRFKTEGKISGSTISKLRGKRGAASFSRRAKLVSWRGGSLSADCRSLNTSAKEWSCAGTLPAQALKSYLTRGLPLVRPPLGVSRRGFSRVAGKLENLLAKSRMILD